LETTSALPMDWDGAGAVAFALLIPFNLFVAAIHVWDANAKLWKLACNDVLSVRCLVGA